MRFKLLWMLLLVGLLVLISGCSSCSDDNNGDDSAIFTASGAVCSNEEGEIETESGAKITVPMYAVPKTRTGENGTMVFSIERDTSTDAPLIPGDTIASCVYRFGPDGFVFAAPVMVTIPVSGDRDPECYKIYRINQTTGEAERYPGIYDAENKTISAWTYELSPWFPAFSSWDDYYDGAINITNNSSSKWLYLTPVTCSLKYPTVNTAPVCGQHSATFAPSGHIGWASSGNWYLSQGVYTFCVEMHESGTFSTPPGPKSHMYIYNVVIDGAWSCWNNHVSQHLSFSSITDPIEGECDCTPTPTPTPGTGDVQVTLTWHNAYAIDIDLWVIEPNGDMCWYMNQLTTTGGTLDRDNKCSDYINGTPENIFWDSAPRGEYIVQVDWFSNCDNATTSQAYDVRVVNGPETRTYSGIINEDATIEVCRFTVSGATIASCFSDFIGKQLNSTHIRHPKD
jgi:hypothetical protein